MEKPELLMPAGSLEKLKTAYAFGADAVYAGVPFFSLRARENEFTLENLETGIQEAHKQNKKLYLTANIFARNSKIKSFQKSIDDWARLRPDALIMSDPGLISIVKEKHPDLPIHLSVQANCMNWASVKFWQSIGVERIILSRELRLEEVKEIKNQVPEMELEAFVHGSICIAYSGRCLLSHYMSHRDANQGVCDNSCRYEYNIYKTEKAKEEDYYIEDIRSKNEFYRINEDENGTYIMNAKDLRLIQYLKEITEAGVCSLKVEGRTKSLYYLSMVTKSYRQAIDDMAMGKDFNPVLLEELDKVPNRGYHEGFMVQQVSSSSQNYDTSVARHHTQTYAGRVVAPVQTQSNRIHIEVRNKLKRGQTLEVISPQGESRNFQISNIFNQEGELVETVHGGTGVFEFEMNFTPEEYSILSLKHDTP